MNEELGPELINKFDLYLQESIKFARNNIKDGIDYAMKYSRGKSRELIEKFVLMYVNEVTVDMGEPGEKAVKLMFKMAKEKGLVPEFELKISKPL
jgi:1,4-dihydroxy-6-naphthoate synthase